MSFNHGNSLEAISSKFINFYKKLGILVGVDDWCYPSTQEDLEAGCLKVSTFGIDFLFLQFNSHAMLYKFLLFKHATDNKEELIEKRKRMYRFYVV